MCLSGALPALVNNVNHAGLLLVSFRALVVEAMQVQGDAGAQR
jgi:hypothetical protein